MAEQQRDFSTASNDVSSESPAAHFQFFDLVEVDELEAVAQHPASGDNSGFHLSELDEAGELEDAPPVESVESDEDRPQRSDFDSATDLQSSAVTRVDNSRPGKRGGGVDPSETPAPRRNEMRRDAKDARSKTQVPGRKRKAVSPDRALEARVRDELKNSNSPEFAGIIVSADKGAVTLAGALPTPAARELAVELATRTPGVSKVWDMLHVAAMETRPTAQPTAPQPTPLQPTPYQPATGAAARPSWESVSKPAPVRPAPPKPPREPFQNPFAGIEFPVGLRTIAAIGIVAALIYGGISFTPSWSSQRPVLDVHPVTGKVLFEGQPPFQALVRLYSADESLPNSVHPYGSVGADGTFKIRTYALDDGAPAGQYVVTVVLYQGGNEDGQNLLPVVYSNAETSPLQLEVKAGQNAWPAIELKK
jgi:hypothetical protein